MYNATKLKENLIGLIGWRQGTPAIDEALTETESGLYYNQEHPLLTMDNLRAIAPKTGDFSKWLKEQTEDGIVRAIQRFLTEKLGAQTAKGVLASRVMFYEPKVKELLPHQGKMVGFEIWPFAAQGVVATIDRIGLHFNKAATIRVQLWHITQNEPIKTIDLAYTRSYSIQWKKLDEPLVLAIDQGGDIVGNFWYLTYIQQPSVLAISTRAKSEIFHKYLEVVPIQVDQRTTIWDQDENEYTEQTGGMSIQVSLKTDFTDFVIDQKHQFKDLISKQVAITLLRQMAFNPEGRINQASTNIRKAEILYELDGNPGSEKQSGLKYEYDKCLEAITVDTERLDNLVFSRKKKSLKFTTIRPVPTIPIGPASWHPPIE